jgi:hypothetical protein
LAVEEVWWPLNAPVTSTHFVSFDVFTVNVSAPPLFAYRVPPLDTVPVPPVNAADDTVEASAVLAPEARSATVPASETRARRRTGVRCA